MSVRHLLYFTNLSRLFSCFLILALLPVEVVRGQSLSTIVLSAAATPSVAEPNVTTVGVTGTGFPSGTIASSALTVRLAPVAPAAGPAMVAVVSAVTTLFGSSRRVSFQVAPANPLINLQDPANYQVSVSGISSGGVGFSSSNTAALTINPPARVQSVRPDAALPGQTLSVTITGVFSNFFQGSTVASFGPGISVGGAAAGSFGPVTVLSATSATVQISLTSTAAPGVREVDVRTGSELAVLPNGFNVSGAPVLTKVNPNLGQQGQQNLSVALTGQFTHFVQGTTMASFDAGITVAALTVNSPTSAIALVNISSTATAGARNVSLMTGGEVVTLTNGFTVTDGTPELTQASPNTGPQGQQNLSIALTGHFTHFVQGETMASFGAGITVASLTVNWATSATALVNISSTAAAHARNVSLTTGSEVVALADGFTVTNGTPVLTQVSPNTGSQGQQNVSVALTGQFTHFAQGTTTASFGAGITVASLTVNSPTSATALANISSTAAAGPHNVSLTTDGEVVTLTNGFTVTNGTPVLTQVNPNTGQQRQQDLSIALTSQFTHFVQGTTTASFGAGITVASLTVNSPISAIALVNISSTAAQGVRNVSLTTGGEVVTLTNGFTVTNGTPVLERVSPNIGPQGQQNLSLTLTGLFTHFVQGTTMASFGADITVASLTVSSATSATAVLNISATAVAGARDVSLTTGSEVVTLTNGFIVIDGTPSLTQAAPNMGVQGRRNLPLVLTGQSTHFSQGISTVSFGAGITIASLAVTSPTRAIAVLTISATASPGMRDVTVTTGTEVVSLANGFTVTNGPPVLTQVSPNTSQQEAVIAPPADTITFDNPPDGLTPNNFIQGSLVVASSQLTNQYQNRGVLFSTFAGAPYAALVNLTGQAPSGTNGIGPANAGGNLDYTQDLDIFLVIPGTSSPAVTDFISLQGDEFPIAGNVIFSAYDLNGTLLISGTKPDSAGGLYALSAPGIHEFRLHSESGTVAYDNLSFDGPVAPNNLSVSLTGQFTHFLQGTTTASFGAGITVESLTVNSPTNATAAVNISTAAAAVGTRDVTVTTGAEVVTLANGFAVIAGTPVLTHATPGAGFQGQQNLSVALSGQFMHFMQGTSVASFGPGITVDSLTVTSPISATAVVDIAANAPLGANDVMVTTGAETVTLTNGFTVTSDVPVLTQLNPNASVQGQQGLSVTLTGQFTHFVQGLSGASFGPDITVASLTVVSTTSATAVLNIAADAAVGKRNVTITTGAEVAALATSFTVTGGVPVLTHVNPNTGVQGQQNLSVALTGQFTNFVQGTSVASFGADITVGSLTVNSATSATAVLNLAANAAVRARNVIVTTGAEVVAVTNGFTVASAAAVLTQVTPNTGLQGQLSLSVTLTGQFTHFVQGTTTAFFGSGVTVASLTVTSSTSAIAVLNISAAAAAGSNTVIVTSGTEIVKMVDGFAVTAGTPALTNINPNRAQQGQTALSVALIGQHTHWIQSATTANFGAGITVTSLLVTSASSAIAVLNIPRTTPTGSTNVTVTTGTEAVTLTNAFTVSAPAPVSFVAAPDSGLQGQTLQVAITATGSHFVQGTTRARFGASVMVGSGIAGDFGPVTVTSPTTATASLTILSSALPASRVVTIQTGSDTLSGNAFTINGAPYLFSANPGSSNRGQQISTVVSGAYTHFAPGVTVASFGPGISVGGGVAGAPGPVTVTSATTFTASLDVRNGASLGLHTITAQTGTETATNSQTFSVTGPVTGPAPTVTITSPTEAEQVTGPLTITGQIISHNLSSWTLSYLQAGTTLPTVLAQGTGTAVSAPLDTSVIMNGTVAITLIATDQSGQQGTATTNIVLTGNLKTGIFTESFVDLSLPVAGIPIQVTRTYDSRFKGVGDFGFGWRLGLNAATISQNRVLGNGWITQTSGGFIPTVCIVETQPHEITITLSDGTTYEFTPDLGDSACSQLYPPLNVAVGFAPAGLTPSNASLEVAGDNQPLVVGNQLIDLDTGGPFDPDQLILTLPTGQTLQVSRAVGLQVATDTNGNSLTIGPTGIFSSTGQSVAFARDGQNRIQTVTDPNGNQLQYKYDNSGNLESFTDSSANTSSYGYDSNHHLISITAPTGAQPLRNNYDANGKLLSHTDAFGNVINFDNDPNTQSEVVTDRNGNVTVNEYDGAGNIIKITDAMGGVKKRTFDANGNVLTITDQLGNTIARTYDVNNNKISETDALGNRTLYTYNGLNQPLTITDPLGNKTTNTYDANGNQTSTKNALGDVTSYAYNSAGQKTSMSDPLGNITQYAYDSTGNLVSVTNPLGHGTNYTYDANGNKISETRTRSTNLGAQTLITSFAYDSSNRAVETTYPDGSTTKLVYNSLGKPDVTIDQLGRQTSYTYDPSGRLTQSKYADGTTESISYDSNSNKTATTDRLGRLTAYSYDALNRLVSSTYPDKSTQSKQYDAAGHVTSVTDALGNVTTYGYDAAGNRTRATDPLGKITTYAYDAAGNCITSTDANGNTTKYKYDPLNRRIGTIYADGTTDALTLDALGHQTTKTDQGGLRTAYQYDAAGELVQVTDARDALTKVTYDEVGNAISQTDPNNHVTTFTYDGLHRPTGRTLSGGQTESMTFDAAGNLKSKTDFNQKTTTYNYDPNNNWLLNKTPDASFGAPAVSFTYTADGQRSSMTDTSGVTSYKYDQRNRLLQKATPQGTLTYSYDAAGKLLSIASSNVNGTSISYSYDADKRLASVTDGRIAAGVTNYGYDDAGNLQHYTYPNMVETDLRYDSLNRLTGLSLKKGSSAFESFAYKLGPTGTRTAVAEISGRTVNYGYDKDYHLTSEAIAGDPTAANGLVRYAYDQAGNRLNRTSTVTGIITTSATYDDDDRLNSETYDAAGNVVNANGTDNVYDFENRIAGANSGAITIVYDGDGNRVAKTVSGVTTKYLVDDRNPSGYAQVLEELVGGAVQRAFTYGLQLISVDQASDARFYGYDGHGSVRQLLDKTGTITDSYSYDAFGNLLNHSGNTANNYLYEGQQFDPDLGLYYLRARYMNANTGRFFSLDPLNGNRYDPPTLHKYLYAGADPVNKIDPSGKQEAGEELAALDVEASLIVDAIPSLRAAAFAAGTGGVFLNELGAAGEDILDRTLQLVEEAVPEAVEFLDEQIATVESGGQRRVIDFGLETAEKFVNFLIEAKSSIPTNAAAMQRLVGQINASLSQLTSSPTQVVLWTLKAPSAGDLANLEGELGANFGAITVVSGPSQLFNYIVSQLR